MPEVFRSTLSRTLPVTKRLSGATAKDRPSCGERKGVLASFPGAPLPPAWQSRRAFGARATERRKLTRVRPASASPNLTDYGTDAFRAKAARRKARAYIPPKTNRKGAFSGWIYGRRDFVERVRNRSNSFGASQCAMTGTLPTSPPFSIASPQESGARGRKSAPWRMRSRCAGRSTPGARARQETSVTAPTFATVGGCGAIAARAASS